VIMGDGIESLAPHQSVFKSLGFLDSFMWWNYPATIQKPGGSV
jgi:hypothetical protein